MSNKMLLTSQKLEQMEDAFYALHKLAGDITIQMDIFSKLYVEIFGNIPIPDDVLQFINYSTREMTFEEFMSIMKDVCKKKDDG